MTVLCNRLFSFMEESSGLIKKKCSFFGLLTPVNRKAKAGEEINL